jgi:hypothetical protein
VQWENPEEPRKSSERIRVSSERESSGAERIQRAYLRGFSNERIQGEWEALTESSGCIRNS